MKKKIKLNLEKEVISNLSIDNMGQIKGGAGTIALPLTKQSNVGNFCQLTPNNTNFEASQCTTCDSHMTCDGLSEDNTTIAIRYGVSDLLSNAVVCCHYKL